MRRFPPGHRNPKRKRGKRLDSSLTLRVSIISARVQSKLLNPQPVAEAECSQEDRLLCHTGGWNGYSDRSGNWVRGLGDFRCGLTGFYTVDQNERAVKTVFGRAQRIGNLTTLDDPIAESLRDDEKDRYRFPQVRVIMPGGPYFKWPWEKVYKVSIATATANMAFDPELPSANKNGTVLEAVTKDQLNTGLTGQIRFQVSERNLYAYLFGVANPIAHVMGYFVSVLRERIATFEAPGKNEAAGTADAVIAEGISINDLRKNLRDLNEHMDRECRCSQARYGILLDASLITGIDPPPEVESALAAINTAHNQVFRTSVWPRPRPTSGSCSRSGRWRSRR